MAGDKDSSADKSEEPTQKRLEKAREDGDTVRSRELNTTAILLTGAAGMLVFGGNLANHLGSIMKFNFSFEADVLLDNDYILNHLGMSIMEGLKGMLPLFAILLVAAILGPIMLGGWNFTTKAISPKASRMNPISGLGRMFGPKSLMELAKSIGKVVVVAGIAILILLINTQDILSIQNQSAIPAILQSVQLIAWAFLFMSAAMLIIVAIDVPFQIKQHSQKLRMTLQQVKDEMKDTEGKPEVKQKIRQLQHQMASNRMMQDVPAADVIITNPTHYSVALRYDQAQQGAPVLLAKGVDLVAQRIRELGAENKVPVVESPELARAIYFNTDIGAEIPAGLYVAVAQILAYIYQLRLYAKGKIRKPKLSKSLDIPDELKHD